MFFFFVAQIFLILSQRFSKSLTLEHLPLMMYVICCFIHLEIVEVENNNLVHTKNSMQCLATRVAYPSATQGKLHCGPLPVKREASTEYM